MPGVVAFEQNYLPGNWLRENALQGTLTFDAKPVELRFTGAYSNVEKRLDHNWPVALNNLFTRKERVDEERNALVNLQATHHLNSALFYQIGVSYSSRSQKIFDSDFGDNWMLYTDSLANADAGYTGFISRWQGPFPYSIIQSFRLSDPNAPINSFLKNDQENVGFSADFTAQINSKYELKIGGRFDRWTMSLYQIGNIASAMSLLYGHDGNFPRQFDNSYQRKIALLNPGMIDFYGYDVDGKKVDEGLDEPRRPSFASVYLQHNLEYGKFIAHLGLRYERYDLKAPIPINFAAPPLTQTAFIDEAELAKTKSRDFLLPRFNVAFRMTSRTEFFTAFGKYTQSTALRDIHMTLRQLNLVANPFIRQGVAGFTAQPEKVRLIEVGIRQILPRHLKLSATAYFRRFENLLRIGPLLADGADEQQASVPLFLALLNEDHTDAKGLELILEFARTKGAFVRANYSYARSNGTEADQSLGAMNYPYLVAPQFFPLSYDQQHRGSIILDYSLNENAADKTLGGLTLQVITSFDSGHRYTAIRELLSLSQATPWNIGVYPLTNASIFHNYTVEPFNSSTTPWVFNVDLGVSKSLDLAGATAEFRLEVLNLFNTKHEINVYPQTGTTEDDAWLRSPLAQPFLAIPNYEAFYKAINQQNRWAYSSATGNDLFGAPRQNRFGIRLEL